MQLFQAELHAAIGQGDRCALCQLVAVADRNHMLSFLREHSSDPMVLEPIYTAWGFCAWHAWALALMEDAERGGVLAMALLADDLLRHLTSIATASESATLPVPPVPGLDSACEMCRAMREEERYWIRHLSTPETSLADALSIPPRFCEPHFRILTETSAIRTDSAGGWRATLRRLLSQRAPQQTHDVVSLLPLADSTDAIDPAVARVCGVRELSPRFSQADDALAPLDDVAHKPPDDDPVTCMVCTAEISAARAACQRLLTAREAVGAAAVAVSGLCHGHRWLLADMSASGENAAQVPDTTVRESTFAVRSLCVICHACWDAASETLRAGAYSAATSDRDTGCLCLAHWSAAERILGGRGQERARLSVRHAQSRRVAAAREELRQYLDYFSVSTRDPAAPPPTTFAWRQALTLLFGIRPQGQCRVRVQ